jgi:ubiquinone/menaquinone biosynthesis C-methylase UbiE
MSTLPYLDPPPDYHLPEVASIFDELSWWSARFGALLLDHVTLSRGMHVLDLACGAGFPLFELAHNGGGSCQFVGLDLWRAALDRANLKRRIYGLTSVALLEGDGALQPFAAQTFDLIVSNLGVNNFANPAAAFAECFRVVKPGGRIALTTNVTGHYREFYAAYRAVLLESGRAERLPRLAAQESHRGSTESLRAHLEGAGFRIVRTFTDGLVQRFADGSTLLSHWLTRQGFLDGWRSVVGPAAEVEVFSLIERHLNALAARDGELRMSVPMLYLEAERPA